MAHNRIYETDKFVTYDNNVTSTTYWYTILILFRNILIVSHIKVVNILQRKEK